MRRTTTSLSLTLLTLAVLAGVLAATPASGQVEAEIEALEVRRDEIGVELDQIDTDLALTKAELEVLDRERVTAEVQIELTADDLERAVDSRREPASTRVAIALVGFTQGDPRENALLDEVLALQGSDESTRARELYTAAIDDAQTRLERAEASIRDVARRLDEDRSLLADVVGRQQTAEQRRSELGQRRADLNRELEETTARIEHLRSLEETALLTGLTTFDAQTRPALAIKIDNVSAARPQAGINQADIVYVEEVEAGLTRLAAVFHSATPEQVGPVRSMRTGDFDLLGQFNSPLFSNSGGNRITRQLLLESTLVDVGVTSISSLYFRTSRRAPHNLFTNPGNIWSVAQTEALPAGLPAAIFRFRKPGDPIAGTVSPATGVDIDYGRTTVSYDWNGTGWDRTQDGSPTVDTDGIRTSPTTVVVQITEYGISPANERSPEAITTGQGEAWILTDGQVTKGFWRRADDAIDQPIEYVDAEGNVIEILPGRTWVEMPREGGSVLR